MSKKPSLAESMRSAVEGNERLPSPTPTPTPAPAPIPTLAVKTSGPQPASTRVGKKKVTAQLMPDDHKRLKRLAVDRDATTEALLDEAINDLFAKYGVGGAGQSSGAR